MSNKNNPTAIPSKEDVLDERLMEMGMDRALKRYGKFDFFNVIEFAMDRYAKQQAVGFARWYATSEWSGFMKSANDERKTLPEIYELFIQSQNKTNDDTNMRQL